MVYARDTYMHASNTLASLLLHSDARIVAFVTQMSASTPGRIQRLGTAHSNYALSRQRRMNRPSKKDNQLGAIQDVVGTRGTLLSIRGR